MTEELTPEDLEAVDASDVDWHETAIALQNEATDLKRQLAEARQNYPRPDGDFIVLGPEIFTGAEGTVGAGIICWKGQNFVPQETSAAQDTPLKEYKSGDAVTVLKNGDWLPGIVSEKDKVSNILHVNTERGPVTIASTRFIKRLI